MPVQIGENSTKCRPAYLPINALKLLKAPTAEPRAIFLGLLSLFSRTDPNRSPTIEDLIAKIVSDP